MANLTDANDINQPHDINGAGRWSVIPGSGSGGFGTAVTNLTNTYVPDVGGLDLARGYVLLKITSDSTRFTKCGSGNDTLRINLRQGPELWVRQNVSVCANNATVQLDPGVSGDSSGVNSVVTALRWTPLVGATPQTGGTFVPNNQSLGTLATYTPPAAFTSGVITMRMEVVSTNLPGTITCPLPTRQFTITVQTVPLVNALDTLKICKAPTGSPTTAPIPAGQATINGTSTIPAGFTVNWTGNGSFTGNGTLVPTYTPTAAEVAAGTAKIVFRVTKTSAPSCGPVSDTLIIGFKNRPTANAGAPFTICKNNAKTFPINGVATNFSTVLWTRTPATGSFSTTANDTTIFTTPATLPTSYTFTLQANPLAGSSVCPAATSNVTVTFTNPDTVALPATVEYCP